MSRRCDRCSTIITTVSFNSKLNNQKLCKECKGKEDKKINQKGLSGGYKQIWLQDKLNS